MKTQEIILSCESYGLDISQPDPHKIKFTVNEDHIEMLKIANNHARDMSKVFSNPNETYPYFRNVIVLDIPVTGIFYGEILKGEEDQEPEEEEEITMEYFEFRVYPDYFTVVLCLDGSAEIFTEEIPTDEFTNNFRTNSK